MSFERDIEGIKAEIEKDLSVPEGKTVSINELMEKKNKLDESKKSGIDYANFLGTLDGILDAWQVEKDDPESIKRRIREAIGRLDEKKVTVTETTKEK